MKRFILWFIAFLFAATSAHAGLEDRFSKIQLVKDPYNFILGPELSANPTGDPASGYWRLFGRANNLYFEDDAGVVTALLPSGATAWDDIGDPDANSTIDFTDYYTTLDFGDTDHDMLIVEFTGSFGNVSGMLLEQKTGNPTDGTIFEIKSADTDVDFMSFSLSGVEKFNVSPAGNLTMSGDLSVAGNLSVSGTTTLTGTMYQAAIASAAAGNVNLSIDAAGSGTITIGATSTGKVSTDNLVEMFGNVDIGNAATDTITITAVVDSNLTLDDGATDSPSLILKDATDETGTFTKADGSHTTFTPNAATQSLQILTGNLMVGNGTPGVAPMDGEDFYCEGASEFDGSMQVDGAATFSNTIAVGGTTSIWTVPAAGYIQIDADSTANTGLGGVLDIDYQTATNGGMAQSITMQVEDGATLSYGVKVNVDDDTSGAEVVHLFHAVNSAGTNATTKGFVSAATIDVGMEATVGAAAKALTVDATTTANTGTTGVLDINFRSATDTSHAINLDVESDLVGAGEIVYGLKIQMDDDAGNADNEIRGIFIDTDANGTGLQHAIYVGGTAGIDAALYAANGYVRIGTGSTPDVTPGDDDLYVEGTLEIDGATLLDGAVTLTNDIYVKKGSDAASAGELDIGAGTYFDITGTTNITSIAAADSIAGRFIVLQFDGALTFTDGNNLKLAGNFVTTADDTITLICDGTNWHEISRSAN